MKILKNPKPLRYKFFFEGKWYEIPEKGEVEVPDRMVEEILRYHPFFEVVGEKTLEEKPEEKLEEKVVEEEVEEVKETEK